MAKRDFDLDKFLAKNKALLEPKRSFDWKIVFYIGILAIAVLLVYMLMTLPEGDTVGEEVALEEIDLADYMVCDNKKCFIEAANAGTPAVFENKVATISLMNTVEEPGVYTKLVTDVDTSEPQEIQDLFLGAMMTCYYTEGQFDSDYIDMISGNIIPCEGDLVDAILAVVV
jgi:hypothetical protein